MGNFDFQKRQGDEPKTGAGRGAFDAGDAPERFDGYFRMNEGGCHSDDADSIHIHLVWWEWAFGTLVAAWGLA